MLKQLKRYMSSTAIEVNKINEKNYEQKQFFLKVFFFAGKGYQK